MAAKRRVAELQISKQGPNGRPAVEVLVDEKTPLAEVSAALQKNVTRNVDILKKVGLRACGSCISGFDLIIRRRFDHVISVELEKSGG